MINRDKFYFRLFCCAFWLLAVGNFIIEEILPFLPLSRLTFIFIDDIIFLFLGLATIRKRSDIVLIAIFLIIAVTSSIYNRIPPLLWINGLRDYIPLILGLPILRYFFTSKYSAEFRDSFDRQLKIFLIIQAFCVTEQFIRYGAGDHGGGSLGNMSSGLISISIILVVFYLVSKDWDGENYLKSLWRNRLYFFLLFPIFLNETKVSFVILFVAIILLYPFKFRSVGKMILAIPAIFLLFAGTYSIYILSTGNEDNVASSNFIGDYLTGGEDSEEMIDLAENAVDFIVEYSDEMAYVDLPRFLKITLIPDALEDSRGGWILGAGAGHFKGGNTLDQTPFYLDHMPLLYATLMTILYILIPFGIIGVIWFILWIKNALAFSKRQGPMALPIKLLLLFIAVLTFFYDDYLRYLVPCCIFFYIALSTTYPLEDIKKETKSNLDEVRNES